MSDDEQPKKSVAFGDATLDNGETVELQDETATAEPHSVPEKGEEEEEEAPAFDPSAMKKKSSKKKKTTEDTENGEAGENGEVPSFDPSAMKKKSSKKKKTTEEDGEAGVEGFDASKMKKKKPKSSKSKTEGEKTDFEQRLEELNLEDRKEDDEPAAPQTQEELEAELHQGAGPWAQDSNAPLKYTQLLKRFYINLYEDHPELSGEGRLKNYKIPPPQVVREGNKKSIFVNLPEIARKMKRNPDHIIQFIFAELGTNGSVDGSGRLVIKGRFQQKQLESVLRRYIVEYLTCGTCKSPNTTLNKENRLFFVNCNICGSRKSVSAIKTGFQAILGKRKKMQA